MELIIAMFCSWSDLWPAVKGDVTQTEDRKGSVNVRSRH